jgi:hypothetical protein
LTLGRCWGRRRVARSGRLVCRQKGLSR